MAYKVILKYRHLCRFHDELAFFMRQGCIFSNKGSPMTSQTKPNKKKMPTGLTEENILKIAKEITVKFIEVGRVSPASFATTFPSIYQTINKTIENNNP